MDGMKKILNSIWNFLVKVGETRAAYVKQNSLYRGY